MSVFSENFNISEVFAFGSLKNSTKSHLSQVYQLLSGLIASCAVGVYLNIAFGYGGSMTGLMGFMCILYVSFSEEKSFGRLMALFGFGILEGMSLGGLVSLSLMIDPSIVVTSLLSTLGILVSFSLAAIWSDRRHALYINGLLGTAVSILFLISIMSLLGMKISLLFNINLYFGLLIFVAFVFVDTQLMINRCENGQACDTYKDALNMFIDAVGIFVRIMIILMKKSKKDKDN